MGGGCRGKTKRERNRDMAWYTVSTSKVSKVVTRLHCTSKSPKIWYTSVQSAFSPSSLRCPTSRLSAQYAVGSTDFWPVSRIVSGCQSVSFESGSIVLANHRGLCGGSSPCSRFLRVSLWKFSNDCLSSFAWSNLPDSNADKSGRRRQSVGASHGRKSSGHELSVMANLQTKTY